MRTTLALDRVILWIRCFLSIAGAIQLLGTIVGDRPGLSPNL